MDTNVSFINAKNRKFYLEICKSVLPGLLRKQSRLEKDRLNTNHVDGIIIGNGKTDFTKGNVVYEFTYKERTFQLIDVPGIEGDESKYEEFIKAAIAKAHLVIFVNGTNKKPEAKTAEKIKKYLKQDAVVYAICNVRGLADSYEFEDDRIRLEDTHKGSSEAKQQTNEVLTKVLGGERILGTENIQGLLAFCAVAFTGENVSSIYRQRLDIDLLKDQKDYITDFSTKVAMKEFSKIDKLVDVISGKANTFQEDIIASNKKKTTALISESIASLKNELEENQRLSKEIKGEIDSCIQAINHSVKMTASSLSNKIDISVNECFTEIEGYACDIIKEYSSDVKRVEQLLKAYEHRKRAALFRNIKEIQSKETSELNQQIRVAVKRLKEDVARVYLKDEIHNAGISNASSFQNTADPLKLNWTDLWNSLRDVGGYAGIGAGLGNLPGAIIGGIIGLLKSIFSFFQSKEKKIREAQAKARSAILKSKKQCSEEFTAATEDTIAGLRKMIEENIFTKLILPYSRMCEVSAVIESQISNIAHYKESITRRQYGPGTNI